MSTRFTITYCLLVVLLFPVCIQGKGKYLVPYKKDKKWGMCDENGTMVLPAKYDQVEYEYPYIFAIDHSRNNTIQIFDVAAHLIDTCYYTVSLPGDKLLILKEKKEEKCPGYLRGNDAGSTEPYHNTTDWRKLETTCVAQILQPHKSNKAINGNIIAIDNNDRLAITWQLGKYGIYDITADTMLQPCVLDSIIAIKPDMLLCMKDGLLYKLLDCDGKAYPYHPRPDAEFINKTTGNYVLRRKLTPTFRWDTVTTTDRYSGKQNVHVQSKQTGYIGFKTFGDDLISHAGKVLIPAERSWDYMPNATSPEYIRIRKSYDSVQEHKSVFQVADLNGNVLIWSAQDIDRIESQVYHIRDIGPEKKDFYYNMATKTVVNQPKNTHNIGLGLGINKTDKDGKRFIFNNNGDTIAIIADAAINHNHEWNFTEKISIEYGVPPQYIEKKYTTYFAIRSSLAEPFTIYDENYKKINSEYEDLTPLTPYQTTEWLSFKKNGKWGLVDHMFHEIVPPIYDSMVSARDGWAMGKLSGKDYHIDLHTMRRIDMTGLDAFAKGPFGGHVLGLKYKPDLHDGYNSYLRKVAVLYLCDTLGQKLDSLEVSDELPYEYCFTGNGYILKYLNLEARSYTRSYAYLLKGLHSQPVKSPGYMISVEKCNGHAVLVQCVSEEHKHALLSANDMSIVVPYGKYDLMFTYPKSFDATDGSGTTLDVLLVKGSTKEMHEAMVDPGNLMNSLLGKDVPATDREDVGYFAPDGKKYWSDK